MRIWRLVFREVLHRKLNFLLALISVSAAVGSLSGALTLLDVDRLQTERFLETKRNDVEAAGAELEDAMRKITKGLGFNVIILPEDQDLNEMHLEGTLSKSMPEEFVHRLANSKIVTVNHLLPTIVRKMNWPEKNLPIVLYGTRGEVPILHSDSKKPLLETVPPGTMIVGFQVGGTLNLKEGDQTTLMGRDFSILKRYEERGTSDDSAVWINLREAQGMFGMENLIHAIQALECQCVGDRITEIRREISSILPGTQVIERGPPALARAEARNKAKEAAVSALEREKAGRAESRLQKEAFAAKMVPASFIACIVWIGILAYGNVRQRLQEIAVFRAIGFRSSQVFALFVIKALLIGILGGLIGFTMGFLFAGMGQGGVDPLSVRTLYSPGVFWLALVSATLMSVFGGWVPAMMAIRADPAIVLLED
ncbi:MAG: ABC transporter permease [Verrucomicrobia bacterium]|nr:ABC transporter permease [Verrucomicrobiota bacterium]